jgi:hypothetical protein
MIVALYVYVASNKEKLSALIQEQFQSNLNGFIFIEGMKPEFFKHFPNIDFALYNVTIRDTNWALHHQDLLRVKHIYIQPKLLPLFVGKFKINKITFSKGMISLFENEQGISNNLIFKKKGPTKGNDIGLKRFELENIQFKFLHFHHHKNFNIDIHRLNGLVKKKKGTFLFETRGDILINQFCFNTHKGSFLKNKHIQFAIKFDYLEAEKQLNFKHQIFNIENQKVALSSNFYLTKNKEHFYLELLAENLNYKEATSWMSPNINKPLTYFNFVKPINIQVKIQGKLKNQPNPWVRVRSNIKDNTLVTKIGKFEAISFEANYKNGSTSDTLFGDEHTLINLHKLSARFHQIPFKADSTYVYNLKSPNIKTFVRANFKISQLNNLIGKNTFKFGVGNASVHIHYKGSLVKNNDIAEDIDGHLLIKDAEVWYLPRMLHFRRGNLNLYLNNQDIELKNSVLQSKNSQIWVSARAKNFLELYKKQPEKVLFEASIFSPILDLNEFQSFLKKRSTKVRELAKTRQINMPDDLDKTFEQSQTNLNIKLGKLIYKKFEANNIEAKINLLTNGIKLEKVALQYADGSIELKGNLDETNSKETKFNVQSEVKNVSIDKFLYGFGSFGQTTFLPENIKGIISLRSQLNGGFDSNAHFKMGSIVGNTTFEIQNGQLIHFKPLIRMGKMIFSKKRLENVAFKTLKNQLSIYQNKIIIPPMLVKSNLINLKLEGIFNLNKGTALKIEIPIFEDNNHPNKQNQNGFKLFINAQDDENGQMHFNWRLKNKEIEAARAEVKKQKKERRLLRK